MQNRDILWAISIPFRMFNTKELDKNTFIFTLSFDAALPSCNVTTARKLISIALEKGWIENVKETNSLRAKFELWEPKLFPPSWKPLFSKLEKVPMIDLDPLDSGIEYKPQLRKIIKKTELMEMEPLFTPESTEIEKEMKSNEKEELVPEEQSPKEGEKAKEKKKPVSKKKAKKKGQKSIQDFFK